MKEKVVELTDEGSAQTAKREELRQMTQVNPSVASRYAVALYQIAARHSAALISGLCFEGEITNHSCYLSCLPLQDFSL